ncbi:MAG: HIT domain-containing protein [Dehalococcoidia bacterium]|nr:HIT domain-containing protein [Dehalococcoidia bacterium]
MDEACLFCKMAVGQVDVPKLHDDDRVFAIRDINPRAPLHLLIVPKQHIADARAVAAADAVTLARMFAVAARLAESEGVAKRGFRLAFNVGEEAGMTIPHLHMHLLGGRFLGAEG